MGDGGLYIPKVRIHVHEGCSDVNSVVQNSPFGTVLAGISCGKHMVGKRGYLAGGVIRKS